MQLGGICQNLCKQVDVLHGYHLSSASAQTPLTFGSAKVFTDSIDLLLACVKPGNRTSFWGGFGSSFALQGHWQIGAHRPGEQFGTIEKKHTQMQMLQ